MSVARVGLLFAFLVGIGLVAGCGSGSDQLGEITGTVTYDGKPVEEGAITFIALDGKSPTAGGVVKDGKYTATKVPVGAAKVSITAVKVVGKKKAYDAPGSPEVPVTESLLPPKYNHATELKFDVKPGSQTKDFELAK